MNTIATTTTITAEAAYEKGWISTAKDVTAAGEKVREKFGEDAFANWTKGVTDKREGNAKWLGLSEIKLPEVKEGSALAEFREEAAKGTFDTEGDPEREPVAEPAEEASTEEDPATEIPVPTPAESIMEYRARITKDLDKEIQQAMRARVVTRKNHYKWGWNSQASTRFKGFDDAEAGYIKRHGDTDLRQDWIDGYNDRQNGLEFGTAWGAK